mgnify:CR=1 FL=1
MPRLQALSASSCSGTSLQHILACCTGRSYETIHQKAAEEDKMFSRKIEDIKPDVPCKSQTTIIELMGYHKFFFSAADSCNVMSSFFGTGTTTTTSAFTIKGHIEKKVETLYF